MNKDTGCVRVAEMDNDDIVSENTPPFSEVLNEVAWKPN